MSCQDAYSRRVSVRIERDASENIIYQGEAIPGALPSEPKWTIMKCTYSAGNNLLTALWADGNEAMDNVWNDRATLTYVG